MGMWSDYIAYVASLFRIIQMAKCRRKLKDFRRTVGWRIQLHKYFSIIKLIQYAT
jgi:hypothetical protein